MPRGPSRPYPGISLDDAIAIPKGLCDHFAGRPTNRILVAQALGLGPAGAGFRDLVTAANKFGLITGNYNSETLALTPLGEQIVRPRSEEERLNALRQAMEKVALFSKLLQHYSNNRLPALEILKSTLEHSPYHVDKAWSTEAVEVFIATGRFTGVIRDVGGSPYVIREAGPPVQVESEFENDNGDTSLTAAVTKKQATASEVLSVEEPLVEASQPPGASSSTRQFFVAHGRDKDALAQLESILKDLDIPYVVAEQEPNAGRPISQKIADLMRSCSAGIFIFSGDDEVRDADGALVKWPRQNVVYELGAASFQYGRRVVIFKERGVEFPTDFRDLGYIEYDKGHLSAKSMQLLRELIKLKAVKVMPGS